MKQPGHFTKILAIALFLCGVASFVAFRAGSFDGYLQTETRQFVIPDSVPKVLFSTGEIDAEKFAPKPRAQAKFKAPETTPEFSDKYMLSSKVTPMFVPEFYQSFKADRFVSSKMMLIMPGPLVPGSDTRLLGQLSELSSRKFKLLDPDTLDSKHRQP